MSEVIQVVGNARMIQARSHENKSASWVQTAYSFEPAQDALRTGLESCGLAADDTATVLSRLAAGQSLEELSRQISSGQILTKRTAHGRRHLELGKNNLINSCGAGVLACMAWCRPEARTTI
jgi:hypothetical protein